jgi:hypothetical protein
MTLQSLIVFVVVACCFGYAGWTLLPQVARRAMANSLLRLPLHASLRLRLERAMASASGACHCSGCEQGSIKREAQLKAVQNSAQPLIFHPRKS